MFINELSEGNEFGLGKGVHGTNRRGSTLLQVDLQIVRSMWGQRISLSLTEDVGVVVILFRNVGEVGNFVRDGSRMGRDGGVRKVNPKTLCSRKFTGMDEGGCTYQGNAWSRGRRLRRGRVLRRELNCPGRRHWGRT